MTSPISERLITAWRSWYSFQVCFRHSFIYHWILW